MAANLTTKLGQLVDVLTPDTTNTRIGVANASPTRTLDVTGTFGASGASTLGGALTYGGVTLSNAVTGTGNMVLSASPTLTGTLTGAAANFGGAVSISSTSGYLMSVIGSVNAAFRGYEIRDGSYNLAGWQMKASTGEVQFTAGFAAFGSFYTWYRDAAEAMRLNSSGLGIGMTPSNILDITQTQDNRSSVALLNSSAGTSASSRFFLSNGSAGAAFQFYGTGFTTSGTAKQNGLFIGSSGAGGIVIDCQVSAPLCFAINDAEVARFDTSGRFLAGCTSTWNSGGTGEFRSSRDGITLRTTSATSGDSAAYLYVENTNAKLLDFRYNGTQISYYSTNGSTTSFSNPSDARYKTVAENQFDYSGPIKAMQMVDFNWTETGASDFGGLAQQAYEAFADTPIRDVLVRKPENPEDKWFMTPDYYGRLALWGVKDLYAENEALKARITALENK